MFLSKILEVSVDADSEFRVENESHEGLTSLTRPLCFLSPVTARRTSPSLPLFLFLTAPLCLSHCEAAGVRSSSVRLLWLTPLDCPHRPAPQLHLSCFSPLQPWMLGFAEPPGSGLRFRSPSSSAGGGAAGQAEKVSGGGAHLADRALRRAA